MTFIKSSKYMCRYKTMNPLETYLWSREAGASDGPNSDPSPCMH